MKDYYELLELSKNASEDTIKKVFRMLIKKNHPDLFEGEGKRLAEEKVKLLNEAYEVLINKEKRANYDLELNKYEQEANDIMQVLIKENEYLKSVITEKDKIIQEFLEDTGNDEGRYIEEYIEPNDYAEDGNYKANSMYTRFKDMIYMLLIIFVGVVALMSVTGINLFEIIVEVFKTMF